MIQTDYPLEAISFLLDGDRLPERYAPLLHHKETLLLSLRRLGCARKSDAEKLPDADYTRMGLDGALTALFRRFLAMYDVKPQKLREVETLSADPDERAALWELYHLPGVKRVRAMLYYRAGYRSLADLAETTVSDVRERTARAIAEDAPGCTVPLPKEARTHIFVARAFTMQA